MKAKSIKTVEVKEIGAINLNNIEAVNGNLLVHIPISHANEGLTINVELQKVFDRNSKRKPKTEIYYILCVTIKKMNGETCNLKNTMEIHNVKGSGLLYKSCKIYAYDSLKQFILK